MTAVILCFSPRWRTKSAIYVFVNPKVFEDTADHS